MKPAISERTLVFLIGAVQFVNILDFMMVMPLGPDFASALGIPASHLGYIGGSYTAAAAVAGLAGGLFLDRFDRRKALAVAMLGLVLGTAAGGFARGLGSLMAARVLAGAFGGPATALSLSIIADVIPPERRGKAMGGVMGAFSVASVLGVPLGLELARRGTWRLPFLAVAGLGLVVALGAVFLLPPLRLHLESGSEAEAVSLGTMLRRPAVWLSYVMAAATMMGGFVLIPNISSYLQSNLGYPRGRLGLLYLVGGLLSFGSMRTAGRLADRFGPVRVATPATLLLVVVIWAGFVVPVPPVPVVVIFASFMAAMAFRNVAYNTLTSRVPHLRERARYLSIQSAVQHMASAIGAFLSARMLREMPDHRLVGMDQVASLAVGLLVTLPITMAFVDHHVGARRLEPAVAPPGQG